MTRREFINTLNDELKNSLDNDNLKKQLDYYDNYISTEIQNGKKESEVLADLGDPRLIAKTIKQVNGDNIMGENNMYNDDYSKQNYNKSYSNDSNNSSNSSNNNSNYYITNFGALGCIVFILILIFIIILILRLLGVVVFGSIAAGSGSILGFFVTFLILYSLFNMFKRR